MGLRPRAVTDAELLEHDERSVPTARRGKGRLSIEGTLPDQALEVHEPGVRRQL
jgi:hypothetical protein